MVNMNIGSVIILVHDPAISKEPPTLTEVREVISKLKGRMASEICGIPAELLRTGSEWQCTHSSLEGKRVLLGLQQILY